MAGHPDLLLVIIGSVQDVVSVIILIDYQLYLADLLRIVRSEGDGEREVSSGIEHIGCRIHLLLYHVPLNILSLVQPAIVERHTYLLRQDGILVKGDRLGVCCQLSILWSGDTCIDRMFALVCCLFTQVTQCRPLTVSLGNRLTYQHLVSIYIDVRLGSSSTRSSELRVGSSYRNGNGDTLHVGLCRTDRLQHILTTEGKADASTRLICSLLSRDDAEADLLC